MRRFESGVLVVQSLSHSEEAVISDTAKLVGGVLQRLYVDVRMHSDTLCNLVPWLAIRLCSPWSQSLIGIAQLWKCAIYTLMFHPSERWCNMRYGHYVHIGFLHSHLFCLPADKWTWVINSRGAHKSCWSVSNACKREVGILTDWITTMYICGY